MSRSATVTLQFIGDTTQVDQAYEAFVRKASRPITIPITGGAPGAAPTGGATTFANASVPGAVPAATASEAFVRRSPGEQQVEQANQRLAGALTQQAAAVQQAAQQIREPIVMGQRLTSLPPHLQAAIAASDPASAAFLRQAAGGGGAARSMSPQGDYWGGSSYTGAIRGGRWGPGRSFDRAMDDLLEQEVSGGGSGGGGGRVSRGRFRDGIGRYLGPAVVTHEALGVMQEYADTGREERLAVNSRGGTDLRRQLSAQTSFAERIASVPIVGQAADLVTEAIWGSRETMARTMQDAAEQDEITRLRKSGGEYTRMMGNRATIAGGEGAFEQGRRRAAIGRNEGYIDAKARADEMRTAGDQSGGDKLVIEASQWLESEFKSSMRDLTRTYNSAFTRVARDIPAMARRAAGDTRTAARMELQADTEAEVTGESDPGMREIRRQRGEYRLALYDTDLRRTDRTRSQELGFVTQAFRRDVSGDESSALRNRQLARRSRELGGLPPDDPNRSAAEEMLTAQEAAERRDFENQRYYRTTGLQGQVRATGLAARGQTFAAQAESIFSRGKLAAREDKDAGRLGDAISQVAIAANELAGLRRQYDRQGTGAEIGAGTLAPGGTQGNFPLEDLSKTIKSIDDMTSQLGDLTRTLKSMLAESN